MVEKQELVSPLKRKSDPKGSKDIGCTTRRQLAELQEMLKAPTNNIGLALLFKKFVLIDEAYQKEEVSASASLLYSAPNSHINSQSCSSSPTQNRTSSK